MSRISSWLRRPKPSKKPVGGMGKSIRSRRCANALRVRNQFGNSLTSIRQKVVAIVDDDPGMRIATANLLSSFGYGTETFDSAEAFLNAAATSKATCLVVDVQLGNISGVELARQLAADSFKYPIIFMTALEDERIQSQAEAVGAIAYLGKPFQPNLLIEAITKAIGQLPPSN